MGTCGNSLHRAMESDVCDCCPNKRRGVTCRHGRLAYTDSQPIDMSDRSLNWRHLQPETARTKSISAAEKEEGARMSSTWRSICGGCVNLQRCAEVDNTLEGRKGGGGASLAASTMRRDPFSEEDLQEEAPGWKISTVVPQNLFPLPLLLEIWGSKALPVTCQKIQDAGVFFCQTVWQTGEGRDTD